MTKPTAPNPLSTGLFFFAWNTTSFAVALFLISFLPVGVSADQWTAFFWAGMVLFIVSRSPIGLQASHWIALFLGSVVFALAFVFTRPLLILICLPLAVVTIGCALLLLNATVLETLPKFIAGFHVQTFGGAVVVTFLLSFITGIIRFLTGPKITLISKPRPANVQGEGEIIDI